MWGLLMHMNGARTHLLMLLGSLSSLCLSGACDRLVPHNHEVEVVRAEGPYDDGAASLAMVLAHHGRHATQAALRPHTNPNGGRSNGLTTVNAAKTYGVFARGVLVEREEDLSAIPPYSIVHWLSDPEAPAFPPDSRTMFKKPIDGQWMVLRSIGASDVILIDPF